MSKADGYFRTLVSNARVALRTATSRPDAEVIICEGDTYRLDPDTFTCDLWTHETACRHAPLDESVHQAAITALLTNGRSDRALALFRQLKLTLAEIDETPIQETYGLFNELAP